MAFALTTSFSQAQIVNIPDAKFKAALLAFKPTIDLNNDKNIQFSEAQAVTSLSVGGMSITNLTGIESFTALTWLSCASNQLTTLNLSKNIALLNLHCNDNLLTTLDLSMNNSLIYLNCTNNKLTSLDLNKNINLAQLYCRNNQLKELVVSNNIALTHLGCQINQLVDLNVSKNTALEGLGCNNNNLTSLDLSKNIALTQINCSSNLLMSLDISYNINLPATKFNNPGLVCTSNPSLFQICINNTHISDTSYWQKDVKAKYSTACLTGFDDERQESTTNKKLVRIYTLLGQDVKQEDPYTGIIIFQYSDGSTKKVIRIEQ